MGQMLFMLLDPRRAQQDLQLFKAGVLIPSFICPEIRQLVMDMTTEDIEARLEAIEAKTRIDAVMLALKNGSN